MRVYIKPTHQIQRINLLKNQLESMKNGSSSAFTLRPNEKSWCGAEILKHMVIAQDLYTQKVNGALSKLKATNSEVEAVKTKRIPSFLIKRFPPIDGKIRFKMKTQKQFQPMLDINQLDAKQVDNIFTEMENSLDQLLDWVEQTRFKEVGSIRFNSAIGPIVRFNVSEACEFILCHNERHFLQLSRTLEAVC